MEGLVVPGAAIGSPSHPQVSLQQCSFMHTKSQDGPLSRLLTQRNGNLENLAQMPKVHLLLTSWDSLAPLASWGCWED